jgi:hypothetical protein
MYDPSVSKFKMWYFGWNSSFPSPGQGFGYAESFDGIIWTKYNNLDTGSNPFANSDPVLRLGNPGSWDAWELGVPTVLKEGGVYRMWYSANPADYTSGGIGYAYSYDGINWTKYDGNPIMSQGAFGDFDQDDLYDPIVINDGTGYLMAYVGIKCSAGGPSTCVSSIGSAESPIYSGPNPVIADANVYTQNTSGGKQIVFGLAPDGPGPLDTNELYVTGPNGLIRAFNDSNLVNLVGQQLISGASNVADFGPYAGTYTYTIKANNGATATKQLTLTPTLIPYPVDGTTQLDRRIELGGNTYDADNAYISGTTPTFKWKPSAGAGYYYRVRVNDLKGLRLWYMSDLVRGDQLQGDGRIWATVPQGMLQPNTPYQYQIEVLDTNDSWTAHNRSRSTTWKFYTGTKGTDFLFNPSVLHLQSFRGGDQAILSTNVFNLAPWDIVSGVTTSPFSVTLSGTAETYVYNIAPSAYQDLGYYQYAPSDYSDMSPTLLGTPPNGIYDFFISDPSSNSDTASRTFTDNPSVPQVARESMIPVDNSYLSTLEPVLKWASAGPGYKYRVRVNSWRNFSVWASSWTNGLALGAEMSVTVPAGRLQPGPYRWFVEAQDGDANNSSLGNNTRTRSQYLTINVGASAGPVNYGNQLAVDFGTGKGFWNYNGTSWVVLSPDWLPVGMESWNGGLAANFGAGYGFWNYNGTNWDMLSPDWLPTAMVSWNGGLAVNFGDGKGFWNFNGTNWIQLSPDWLPVQMIPWTGGLAVDFGSGKGFWNYDGANWVMFSSDWLPVTMKGWNGGLAVDFGTGKGFWNYNGANWDMFSADWLPADMTTWNGGLGVNFGDGKGFWNHNGTNWVLLSPDWLPAKMSEWNGGLAIDFGTGRGFWTYNGTTWTMLSAEWLPEKMQAWAGGLAIDFGTGKGFWTYNGTDWNMFSADWLPVTMQDWTP